VTSASHTAARPHADHTRARQRRRRGLHHGLPFDRAFNALLKILVIVIFIVTFIVQPFRIPSGSMEPTLRIGDSGIADKQSFAPEGLFHRLLPPTEPRRGDLAVFHFPPDPTTDLVKRIIALPGDRIRLLNGRVLLNGQPLAEPYAFYGPNAGVDGFRDNFPSLRSVDPDVDPAWWTHLRPLIHDGEITVPPNSYFVLGDNRNDSEDSRYWGFVPRPDLVGRPLVVYLTTPPADITGLAPRLRAASHGFHVLH
jgi:signal peptidase I